jgi:hypothetical protein
MFCDGAALHPATVAAQSMADTTIGDLIRRTGDIGARPFLRNSRKPFALRIILGGAPSFTGPAFYGEIC